MKASFSLIFMTAGLTLAALGCGSDASTAPLLAEATSSSPAALVPTRGLLASPGLDGAAMKGVFYFPGDWEATPPLQFDGRYASLGGNDGLYTRHPADARHLGFSEAAANRTFAVQSMAEVGANVIVMSYWGPPGTDNWMKWAPMQDSPQAQEELFDAALGSAMVIMPSLEDSAATACFGGHSPAFRLAESFPRGVDDPSNMLTSWVLDLVTRFITNPQHPEWAGRFAQLYDAQGTRRYVIQLKDVSSAQPNVADASFAAGFDQLADAVKKLTGVDVGFVLDPLERMLAPGADGCTPSAPPPTTYIPRPASAGPLLAASRSVVAIQAFRSEITAATSAPSGYPRMIAHKRDYCAAWGAYLPVIADVSAGYDGHRVFPGTSTYGHDDAWRNDQSQLRSGRITGMVFTAWNGYTEGWTGMPTLEREDDGTDPATMKRWLTALYAPDVRECNHVHFVDGQPTFYVYGAICEKYYATGGSRGVLGDPTSSEHGSVRAGVRRTDFAHGSILWEPGGSQAYEVNGLIAAKYRDLGYEGAKALGVPTSDEQDYDGCGWAKGRYNQFESGKLVWCAGWSEARLAP